MSNGFQTSQDMEPALSHGLFQSHFPSSDIMERYVIQWKDKVHIGTKSINLTYIYIVLDCELAVNDQGSSVKRLAQCAIAVKKAQL